MLGNKPLIGVTAEYREDILSYRVNAVYDQAIIAAGGIPVMLCTDIPNSDVDALLEKLDGVLIPGGPDIQPLLYGEEPQEGLGITLEHNDVFEIYVVRKARELHKPIFGICRGMQIINVAFGGTLYQDIPSQRPKSIRHLQRPTDRREETHTVLLKQGSWLEKIYGVTEIRSNSFHHQAVKNVAEGFTVSGWAKDGVVECIEIEKEHIFGIQWHPEELYEVSPIHHNPFKELVRVCKDIK